MLAGLARLAALALVTVERVEGREGNAGVLDAVAEGVVVEAAACDDGADVGIEDAAPAPPRSQGFGGDTCAIAYGMLRLLSGRVLSCSTVRSPHAALL